MQNALFQFVGTEPIEKMFPQKLRGIMQDIILYANYTHFFVDRIVTYEVIYYRAMLI